MAHVTGHTGAGDGALGKLVVDRAGSGLPGADLHGAGGVRAEGLAQGIREIHRGALEADRVHVGDVVGDDVEGSAGTVPGR